MLENLIAGSLGEVKYSDIFQIVFKTLPCSNVERTGFVLNLYLKVLHLNQVIYLADKISVLSIFNSQGLLR